jgi:hypothetical protein
MAVAYACEGGSNVISVQRSLGLIAVAAAVVAATGCSSMVGNQARGPDETAVSTRAPLVVPATFDLKAPQPGAPRPQDADSAAAAQRILGGTNTVKSAPASDGERALLAASGAQNADPKVRQELRQEVRDAAKRKSYADGVLFWRGDKVETGTPLIAAEEAEHAQTIRRPVAQPAQPAPVIEKAPEPPPAAEAAADAKEAEQKTEAEEEGGGWFDWF